MENNQFRGFDIVEDLGSGAFSKTVLAEQNGRRAVIKTIEMPNQATMEDRSADYVKSDEFAEAMRTAGTQLNRLLKTLIAMPQTPGLMRYYDYTLSLDSDRGIYTLAVLMEYDTPLTALLETGDVPVGAVLRMASQLCEGLDAMQKKYIVHGNIKESNIFYNPRTGFKLGDFFINDILSTSLTPDRSFKSYGYRFLAPEAYETGEYSYRTDIFCLGMMLYRIFNRGRLPFDDGLNTSLRQVKNSWDKEQQLPAPALDIPEITKILNKATAYDADDRYSTYLQMKVVIDRLLSTLPKEVLYTKLSDSVVPQQEATPASAQEPAGAREAETSDEEQPPITRRLKRVAVPDDRQESEDAQAAAKPENPLIPPSFREEAQHHGGRPVRQLVRHYEPPAEPSAMPQEQAPPQEYPEKKKTRMRLPNESVNYFDYNSEDYSDPKPGKGRRRIVLFAVIGLVLCGLAVGAGFLVKYLAG